ncbi:MAG: hypothetical protein KA020_01020 [Planctomycetes bacterium]|nr:hypothetical protein [Planctomycetota bacterium]
MDVFFGIQVAVQAPPHDPWRTRLEALVRGHQRDLSVRDKRTFYGSLANLLREAIGRCSMGFWDFVPNGKTEFDDWCKGIEDDTAEGWIPDASGARMDHVLVSAMFLLPTGGPSALLAGERCDLPESTWQRRSTWLRLFETLAMFPFASVRSDAVYVTPGGERLGFSLRELQGKGYEYLLPVK